jgi:hypothetical protein
MPLDFSPLRSGELV